MHPGPMNRGVEIDSSLADNLDRSVIHQQVENGRCCKDGMFGNVNCRGR